MRLLVLLLLLTGPFVGQGQRVSYAIPVGLEQTITPRDYKKLVDGSVTRISKRFKIDSVGNGSVLLGEGQGIQVFHLHNLIGKYAAVSGRKQRRKVVAEHFDQLFASIEAQNRIDPDQFDSVRQLLTTRIYPAAAIRQQGGTDSLVMRTDAAETYTLLLLDLPGRTLPVQKSQLMRWGRTEAEGFAAAEQNVRAQQAAWGNFTATDTTLDIAQLGDADYAARLGLDLDRQLPELLGEMGSVLAVSRTGAIAVYKIDRNKPVDIVAFVERSKAAAGNDAQYFWYYKGKFTAVDVRTDESGTITVTTPNELSQLLSLSTP